MHILYIKSVYGPVLFTSEGIKLFLKDGQGSCVFSQLSLSLLLPLLVPGILCLHLAE